MTSTGPSTRPFARVRQVRAPNSAATSQRCSAGGVHAAHGQHQKQALGVADVKKVAGREYEQEPDSALGQLSWVIEFNQTQQYDCGYRVTPGWK